MKKLLLLLLVCGAFGIPASRLFAQGIEGLSREDIEKTKTPTAIGDIYAPHIKMLEFTHDSETIETEDLKAEISLTKSRSVTSKLPLSVKMKKRGSVCVVKFEIEGKTRKLTLQRNDSYLAPAETEVFLFMAFEVAPNIVKMPTIIMYELGAYGSGSITLE